MFRSYRDTVRTPVKVNKEVSRKYYCDLCEDDDQHKAWDLELDVEIHRRRVHKMELMELMREPKNYMCTLCLRRQTDRVSLIAHIKKHHLLTPPECSRVKREIFVCNYCKNIFFNKQLLVTHIQYFHLYTALEKMTAKTQCPACYKNLAVRAVWFHFVYHGIINTATCPICLSTFEDYTEVLDHIESHPGYYSCSICPYEAKNEGLFQNHVEKHKKSVYLEGRDDVKLVSKFFVPQRRAASWSRKFLNIFKGITLAPELQICVLCRMICETDEEMLQHIYGDHSPENIVEIKRHICTCGEEFFNNVLLKHHVFTMKGDHEPYIAATMPKPKRQRVDSAEEVESHVPEHNYGIEVEVQSANPSSVESTDNNHNNEPESTDEQIVLVPIIDNTEDNTVLSKCNDKSRTALLNTDQQMLYVTIDQALEEPDATILRQPNEMDKTRTCDIYVTVDQNSDVIEESGDTQKTRKCYETRKLIKCNRDQRMLYVTIDPNPVIDEDNIHIIRKRNELLSKTNKRQRNSLSLTQNNTTLTDSIVDETEENTDYVCDERVSTMGTVPKLYGAAKRYYEQGLGVQDNMDKIYDSPRASRPSHYVSEAPDAAILYETVQVPAEANEDGSRTVEKSIYS